MMIPNRHSNADKPNAKIQVVNSPSGETNSQWIERTGMKSGVILFGGSSISHFRLRVAQSHVRWDLTPSYWSLAGILLDGRNFISAPLDFQGDASIVGQQNGIQQCRMKDYDDPDLFPNVAVIEFSDDLKKVHDFVKMLRDKQRRDIVDLPSAILPWLSFIWAAGKGANPLTEGLGIPSAILLETVFGMAGIELTPGLASSSSCPEGIWQSARWWHEFYDKAEAAAPLEGNAKPKWPEGKYTVRQFAAAAVGPNDRIENGRITSALPPPTAPRTRSGRK
jgi:hypothetical protein